jgi:hypothetical protein
MEQVTTIKLPNNIYTIEPNAFYIPNITEILRDIDIIYPENAKNNLYIKTGSF